MNHFHDQEAKLLTNTSLRTFTIILLMAIFTTIGYIWLYA